MVDSRHPNTSVITAEADQLNERYDKNGWLIDDKEGKKGGRGPDYVCTRTRTGHARQPRHDPEFQPQHNPEFQHTTVMSPD